jgi:outer membrane protein assembly factor BamE (lipoprotein component of BamABCDE complex)
MPLSAVHRRLFPISAAIALSLVLTGCMGSGLSLTQKRTQGYEISEDALAQIRPGQSQDLVTVVLGSPQTTNSFGNETAFYYIQTKVERTAFGMDLKSDRTVLAIYFDKNRKVTDKAVYGSKDGKVFQIQSRKTPSFGEDRTFIESIIKSF